MTVNIGDLVESEEEFSGVGKVDSLNEVSGVAVVSFFVSPLRPNERMQEAPLAALRHANIYEEASVYVVDEPTGVWRRGRYGSRLPDGRHLVTYPGDDRETAALPASAIHVLSLGDNQTVDPIEFLAGRCTETPLYHEWRQPFLKSYVEQRAACKSISSILSSGVEIEPHQIAVVRRVLQDPIKRYLLADEVGLGKTIEACLVIREHVLQDERNAQVLIAVPAEVVDQWRKELTERFYLGDLLDRRIFVFPHGKLPGALDNAAPTMIVVDEAHQIAPWAWSEFPDQVAAFQRISKGMAEAENCLLLTGTPLAGNETNFLAILHLLTPERYELTSGGLASFKRRLVERERLGGIYQALVPSNDNDSLTDIVDEVVSIFPEDEQLLAMVTGLKPRITWSALTDDHERNEGIRHLRHYLGETYRLHQRMLRNRREDAAIAGLFPGLAGPLLLSWPVDERCLSVDQELDAYRDEFLRGAPDGGLIGGLAVMGWMALYLASPILVSERASKILGQNGAAVSADESVLLKELVKLGAAEQVAKDATFREGLRAWLSEHPRGKAIVFCGDPEVADALFGSLQASCDTTVERHQPPATPRFQRDLAIRILVCDARAEDGLNLHGGEKLLVHYSVPLSVSQIEQRNGRANRYSAGIHARPVKSLLLLPDRPAFFRAWIDVLSTAIGIFDRSVASLQYVLQEQLESAISRFAAVGITPLKELTQVLAGPQGLLERERRRVEAQDQLEAMNEEVEEAKVFAEELQLADEQAEAQGEKMLQWMCKGLRFAKQPGEVAGAFRLQYSSGENRGPRTLVDVATFIEQCITGIDYERSRGSAPVTALMSADRQLASLGRQVYPMRFGQPFVDVVYDMSKLDTRGTCSAWLRQAAIEHVTEPTLFFEFVWLLDGCAASSTARERRIADEVLRPRIQEQWVDALGKPVKAVWDCELLRAPYSKHARFTDQHKIPYRDSRIRHDMWEKVHRFFPRDDWIRIVREAYAGALATTEDSAREATGSGSAQLATAHLQSTAAIIVVPAKR